MSKRKFEQYRERKHTDKRLTIEEISRQQGVYDILNNGKTNLFRALKVARGFERQKLGRRQKTAEKEQTEAVSIRLKEEVKALKDLDLEKIAELHLHKTLLKIKSIASSQLLPPYVSKLVESAKKQQCTASVNVQARLFKSTAAKTVVNEIVVNVRGCLQAALQDSQIRKNEDGSAKGASNVSIVRPRNTDSEAESTDSMGRANGMRRATGSEYSASSVDEVADVHLIAHEQRIVDSEDESLDGFNEERRANSDWSGSEGPSVTDHEDCGDDAARRPAHKHQRLKSSKESAVLPPKSTTFLPTLAMGGYWSGSEEGSDVDEAAGKIEVRRNKRGQRARQKIYEKKYGANANHVKKAAEGRDQGWDPRRGAKGDDDRNRSRKGRDSNQHKFGGEKGGGQPRGTRGPLSSGANMEPVKPRAKRNNADGPIHPSWEAARKAKEQKQSTPFQGKKITFD